MRDAVRRTILDLKQTNLSIERFVPQAFLAIIGKPSIVDVALGDNRRQDMTILFSDIRNFTTLSESMTPDDNFAFINAFLARMGPVIRTHNGFIDKYSATPSWRCFREPTMPWRPASRCSPSSTVSTTSDGPTAWRRSPSASVSTPAL
jgi:class 3 adenylate cyclase